jgi:hypothetical protein
MSHGLFELIMAFVLAICIGGQLLYGTITLHRAPKAWRHVERNTDPGRYWAFIIATALVMIVLVIDGSFSRS